MRKLLVCILLSIVIVSAYSYADETISEDKNQKQWTSEDGVLVTASLAKKVYSPSEQIMLSITFTNKSKSQIKFWVSWAFNDYKIQIVDENKNKNVPFTKMVEDWSILKRTFRNFDKELEPGESHTEPLELEKCWQLSACSKYSVSIKGSYIDKDKKTITFEIKDLKFEVKK